ncbi:MAG: hypothetical protein C0424_05245 [Sphingobacteriaceae bacterium]|nr:hypothetical protein [Sphingobacteriaceae bacterium]
MLNFNSLNNQHVVHTQFGLNQGFVYGIGYSYLLPSKRPVALRAGISLPMGQSIFDDVKVKIGAEYCVYRSENFQTSVSAQAIYRRMENSRVAIQNVGTELNLSSGIAKSNWFLLANMGIDNAWFTHLAHSDIYRREVFMHVNDGWYGPFTSSLLHYGISAGWSFTKGDVNLSLGQLIGADFNVKPFLPFYFNVGYNVKM